MQLAVEHDGDALRRPPRVRLLDPYGRRVLGDVRQETVTRSGPARPPRTCAAINAGGSKFCGTARLLPLQKDETPPQRI